VYVYVYAFGYVDAVCMSMCMYVNIPLYATRVARNVMRNTEASSTVKT